MVEIERLATARSWWLRASLRSAAMAWLLTAVAAWTPGAAAAPGKRRKPDPLVERYQHALGSGTLDDALGPLLAGSDTRAIGPELDALAAVLVAHKDRAAGAVELLSKRPHPAAPCAAAELLWRIALKKGLTDELASLAAGLLDHDDPFVRALAEWAIATRVEIDNKGQQIAWPRPQAPDWFRRWSALPADRLLEADYARMAVVWGIHYDGRKLLDSVGAIRRRARDAAGEALQSPDAGVRATVARQLQVLDAIQRRLAERVEAAPETTVAFRSAKERDFRGAKGDSAPDLTAQRKLWLAARRAARPIVLANPAIDFDELLLIKRHSAHSHRNITGSQYPWVHKPGGDICVQSGLEPGSPVRGVLGDRLGPGHVHGMDLWWDADRVVFAYARQPKWPPPWDTVRGNHVFLLRGNQEPTHLYEIRLDGSGLRQLTDDPYWSDLEPTYCADGGVVFASDRSGRSSECGRFSADHTVINIYRIDADAGKGVRDLSREAPEGPFRQKAPAAEKGSGTFCAKHPKGRSGKRSLTPFPLRRLSDNKDIDRYPHSLANGLIAYTRWEYQERHFFEVHSIWTVRPDGTMADAVFNQHLRAPFGFRDTRSVPGSPKLVSIARPVPDPLGTVRDVLSGVLQLRPAALRFQWRRQRQRVCRLPDRRPRQQGADPPRSAALLRVSHAAAPASPAAGPAPREGARRENGHLLRQRRLRRHGGRAARRGEAPAHFPARGLALGSEDRGDALHPGQCLGAELRLLGVGPGARDRHRARRGGRLGLLQGALRHRPVLPGPGR